MDALIAEAWSAHLRDQVGETLRAQRARQDEANRQEVLAILTEMRRRGWDDEVGSGRDPRSTRS